jgi:hypothetical protein
MPRNMTMQSPSPRIIRHKSDQSIPKALYQSAHTKVTHMKGDIKESYQLRLCHGKRGLSRVAWRHCKRRLLVPRPRIYDRGDGRDEFLRQGCSIGDCVRWSTGHTRRSELLEGSTLVDLRLKSPLNRLLPQNNSPLSLLFDREYYSH